MHDFIGIPVARLMPAHFSPSLYQPSADQSTVKHLKFTIESIRPCRGGVLASIVCGGVGMDAAIPDGLPVKPGDSLMAEFPLDVNPLVGPYTAIYPANQKPKERPVKTFDYASLSLDLSEPEQPARKEKSMFQSTPVTGRQRRSEEVTPLPNVIIPMKGEVSNRSQFSMNQLTQITNQPITMSSREIAELVGSRHDKVKQSIERLANQGVITLPPMGEVSNPGPGPKTIEIFIFSGERGKRDSLVVVAQLCPEFTARIVDRWQELEARVAQPAVPQTLPEALRLAADLAEQKALLEHKVEEQAPKVAALERIASSRENMPIRVASKVLDIKEQRLIHDLEAWRKIYRLNKSWVPYREQVEAGYFVMKYAKYHDSDGQEVEKPYCHITPKGLADIAKRYAVAL